jgi:hypothetical protein
MVATTDVLVFANNASATLNGDLTSGNTSIALTTGQGARFPSLSTNQFFPVTLQNYITGDAEICYCTARSGDTLTVERAREGTLAQSFPAAQSIIQMRVTKGVLDRLIQKLYTAADAGKYLQVQSTGQVLPASASLSIDGVSYLAAAETHTAGKGTLEYPITSLAGAANLNPQLSNAFYMQLTENVTLTMTDGRTGQVISLAVQQNGTGGFTLTFSGANIQLANGDVQADANSITHYSARWVDAAGVWIVAGALDFVAV